jgi:hypothetical protein
MTTAASSPTLPRFSFIINTKCKEEEANGQGIHVQLDIVSVCLVREQVGASFLAPPIVMLSESVFYDNLRAWWRDTNLVENMLKLV